MIKFYPDGYPFILGFLLSATISLLFLIWNIKSGNFTIIFYGLLISSGLLWGLTLFIAYFFRDPERNIPEGENIFVSPADGKVILISDVQEQVYLKSDTKEVSIFMSPFNVHVNRAPCDGIVTMKKHSPGTFKAAYSDDASIKNENIVMVLDEKESKILVRQVAGFLARRAVCKAKVGDVLKRGERYGMIKFGSRLDVYLPKYTDIKVTLGEKVKAGETIIGELKKE